MNDSANQDDTPTDIVDTPDDAGDFAIPGFQPPSRTRYRPSEAWALRWLGTPSR